MTPCYLSGGATKKKTTGYLRTSRKVRTSLGPRCVYIRKGQEYVKMNGKYVTVRAATGR